MQRLFIKAKHYLYQQIMAVPNCEEIANSLKRSLPSILSSPAKVPALDQDVPRVKRKMCAVLVMYSGWGFYGFQRSPTHPTIEGEIIKALVDCNYMDGTTEEDFKKAWFKYASKTDKSVSALGQVCALMLPLEDDVKQKLNAALPKNIRVLDVFRTTKAFHPRHSCNHRVYDYFFPTFALAPRPVNNDKQSMNPSFRLSAELLTRVNTLLSRYVGTHNFYNFTSGRPPTDRGCSRYMISVECLPPTLFEDWEYAVIRVVGQSFMLHQIRKMIGLVIAIMRGNVDESAFDFVFLPERVDVPRAPGLGLMLNHVAYTRYNERYGNDTMHKAIDWTNYEDEMYDFKMKNIYPVIHRGEVEEKSMVLWLEHLDKNTYCNPSSSANPEEVANSPASSSDS